MLERLEPTARVSPDTRSPAGSTHASPALGPRIFNMPPLAPTGLIDRPDLESELEAATKECSTVILHGFGGAGKTQLAASWFKKNWESYQVWDWLDAEHDNGESSLLKLAEKMGIRSDKPLDSLFYKLSQIPVDQSFVRPWMFVFDNARSGFEESEIFLRMKDCGSGLIVVTTTDTVLKPLGKSILVGAMTDEEAVKLLCSRAGVRNEDGATALANLLGHFPLALAQAASFRAVTGESFRQIQSRLADDFGAVMEHGSARDPGHQMSVRATTRLILERACSDPIDGQRTKLLALTVGMFSADPIPEDLLFTIPNQNAGREDLNSLYRFHLINRPDQRVQMHRVTSEVLRSLATDAEKCEVARQAVTNLRSHFENLDFATRMFDQRTWIEAKRAKPHTEALFRNLPLLADREVAVYVLELFNFLVDILFNAGERSQTLIDGVLAHCKKLAIDFKEPAFLAARLAKCSLLSNCRSPGTLEAFESLRTDCDFSLETDPFLLKVEHETAFANYMLGDRENAHSKLKELIPKLTDNPNIDMFLDWKATELWARTMPLPPGPVEPVHTLTKLVDQYKNEAQFGPLHPETLRVRGNLAHWIGRSPIENAQMQSLRLFEELLPERVAVSGERHEGVLSTRYNIARIKWELGKFELAAREFQKLAQDYRAEYGPDWFDVRDCELQALKCWFQKGENVHDRIEELWSSSFEAIKVDDRDRGEAKKFLNKVRSHTKCSDGCDCQSV
jgi:hypothetical protein